MQLLEIYRSRFGDGVKRQGNGWNGPCPLCGGEPGKSDRFMVWPERDEGLGQTCAAHHITGIWSCRQCGQSGDTIAYLTKVEGLDFRTALAELGLDGAVASQRRRRAPQEPRPRSGWQPRVWPEPSAAWQAYAAKLLDEADERIWQEPQALRWLAARGIDADAVRAYRIGYLPPEGGKYPGRWRARVALGLEPRTGEDGREHTKLFIPRGIVIPTLGADGRVLNLRIRRHKEDLRDRSPKYMELEGSCKAPMLLRAPGPSSMGAYFVTEAELDAILIHHATGGAVGALAVRTNRGKPDAAAHLRLREALLVGVALDYDQAGAEGVDFWEATYPASKRWPTPEGKDPGDAFRLGVDIREWIAAALPPSVALWQDPRQPLAATEGGQPRSGSAAISAQIASDSESHTGCVVEHHADGRADTSPTGQFPVGGGGCRQNDEGEGAEGSPSDAYQRANGADTGSWPMANPGDYTAEEAEALQAALPASLPLSCVYRDVVRVWLLWRRLPVAFQKSLNAAGQLDGWGWVWPPEWRGGEALDAFFKALEDNRALWWWLFAHPAKVLTAKNLLQIVE